MNSIISLALWITILGFYNPSALTLDDQQVLSRYQNPGNILTDQSKIYWKGTKLMGSGSHEGTVSVSAGNLDFQKGQLTGGHVVADMTSIYITDIPLSDPIPRRNLTNHLNSDFETEKFPEARFLITEVSSKGESEMNVTGDLTIKGVTHPISVPIETTSMGNNRKFESTFSINRFKWGIGEDGSWLEKKLVDEEFELRIEIVAAVPSGSSN